MIIKKYIVNDMKEALVRAKYELGGNAIIISQREIRTGKWYNPFKKKELEVTVALEEDEIDHRHNNPTKQSNKAVNNDYMASTANVVSKTIEKLNKPVEDRTSFIQNFDINETIKEQLASYCKLHGKDETSLTLEDKKDFFSIIFKDSFEDKNVELSRINVLIGPTGVGKTTTIAKIAAKEYLVNKNKVGLITIDTYRIGAVEQLRTYANILGIPFEVVNKPEEMVVKINKLHECDIILIDTLGTSPKDLGKIEEIKALIQTIEEKINTYLVFSISTDKDTIVSILERYLELKYNALIITKLDEVSNISNLLYILKNNPAPIHYFCHGQNVPDDIKDAPLDNIIEYCEENF